MRLAVAVADDDGIQLIRRPLLKSGGKDEDDTEVEGVLLYDVRGGYVQWTADIVLSCQSSWVNLELHNIKC